MEAQTTGIVLPPESNYIVPESNVLSHYDPLSVNHFNLSATLTKLAYELLEFFKTNQKALIIKEFCTTRNVTEDDLNKFAKRNVTFARALEIAREHQTARLILAGLDKKHNGNFAANVLRNLNKTWKLHDDDKPPDTKTAIKVEIHLPPKGAERAVEGKYTILTDSQTPAPTGRGRKRLPMKKAKAPVKLSDSA